jgi:phage gpG-like protein
MDSDYNIEISSNYPVFEVDYKKTFEGIEELMLQSVQMNLTMGGRPEPFAVRHPNETPLVGSGKMYAGVQGVSDDKSATVYVDSSVVSSKGFFYPKALNDGFDVPPFGTPKEERFNTPVNMLKGGKGVYKRNSPEERKLRRQGITLGGALTAVKVMVFVIDGHTVFTTTRKGYHVGAFPFMIFQEQDKVRILEMLRDSIFIQQGETLHEVQ